ncbi:hypothetical protein PsorP6_019121 [Peronosclerospora sorghi]|nr:hypothetical protein PsorP6_019121 [Peronosclerospora sorghi]
MTPPVYCFHTLLPEATATITGCLATVLARSVAPYTFSKPVMPASTAEHLMQDAVLPSADV